MDTTTNRLADVLDYRLREYLGTDVEYRAHLLPNVLGLEVVMVRPEHLRGFTFMFREGEPLPPQIREHRYDAQGIPVTVPVTNPPMTFQLQYQATDRTIRETQVMAVTTAPTVNPIPARPLIPTRTIEQEARLQNLENIGMDRVYTAEESVEYNRLRAIAPCPTPIPARTYVRVHRDDYRNWVVAVRVGQNGRDLPTIAIIKSLLNPSDKHYLPSRQGKYRSTVNILRTALSAGLPPQSLVDALRAWVMATENQVTSAESVIPVGGIDRETANLLKAQPATLEVGGMVYRLVPCHQTDVRPLIARVRAKALSRAQVEAASITVKATTDARVTVTEAERTATRLRTEAERAARLSGARVPDWVRDSRRAHHWTGSAWIVEIKVQCLIRDIRLYIPAWASVLHWKPLVILGKDTRYYERHLLPLSFRLNADGSYDKYNISASWPAITTHIQGYMCMDLQGLPSSIKSNADLIKLEECISRGMQVINLNSPLDTDYNHYWPDFKEQIPPIVIKWLKGEVRIEPSTGISISRFKELVPTTTWDSVETIKEEEEGTFSTSNPPIPLRPIVEPPLGGRVQGAGAIDPETVARLQEVIERG